MLKRRPTRSGYHRLPGCALSRTRLPGGCEQRPVRSAAHARPTQTSLSSWRGPPHLGAPAQVAELLAVQSQGSGFGVARPAKHSLPHNEAIACAAPSKLCPANQAPPERRGGKPRILEHGWGNGHVTRDRALLPPRRTPVKNTVKQINACCASSANPQRFASHDSSLTPRCTSASVRSNKLVYYSRSLTSEPSARPGGSSHRQC